MIHQLNIICNLNYIIPCKIAQINFKDWVTNTFEKSLFCLSKKLYSYNNAYLSLAKVPMIITELDDKIKQGINL